jgi:hypothetical protein
MTSAQSRANKAKGRAFERAVADLFQEAGFLWSDRKPQRGVRDQGDITGIDGWTLELKDTEPMNFSGLLNEAIVEAANANTPWFAGIQKRRGKHARDAYVVLPLWLFIRLVKHLLGMDPPVCRDCGRAA